jgi:hypothetical protein
VPAGSPSWRGGREQGLDQLPFGVREVRKVAYSGGSNRAPQRILDSRAATFSDGFYYYSDS